MEKEYVSEILKQVVIISQTARELCTNYNKLYDAIKDTPVLLEGPRQQVVDRNSKATVVAASIPPGLIKYMGRDGEKFMSVIVYVSLMAVHDNDEQEAVDAVLDAMNFTMADPNYGGEEHKEDLKTFFKFFLDNFNAGKALVKDYNSLIQ